MRAPTLAAELVLIQADQASGLGVRGRKPAVNQFAELLLAGQSLGNALVDDRPQGLGIKLHFESRTHDRSL
jgi:hypothetical protein